MYRRFFALIKALPVQKISVITKCIKIHRICSGHLWNGLKSMMTNLMMMDSSLTMFDIYSKM